MDEPTVYADFNNADSQGFIRLSCVGTAEDLSRLGIQPREGMHLTFHDEELEANGEVHFSLAEQIWVAQIDWDKVRRTRASQAAR
jgi:hypothetical protein